MQLEIELTSSGATIIREVPDVVAWPETGWDDDFYKAGLGLFPSFRVGRGYQYSVAIYGPSENNKTGGKWMVVIDDGNSVTELWAAHLGVALAFLREQAAVITADRLGELAVLYQQERDDADARVKGYENRWDEEARDRAETKAYWEEQAKARQSAVEAEGAVPCMSAKTER